MPAIWFDDYAICHISQVSFPPILNDRLRLDEHPTTGAGFPVQGWTEHAHTYACIIYIYIIVCNYIYIYLSLSLRICKDGTCDMRTYAHLYHYWNIWDMY